tara:strand:+ start:77 stop:460 length:384 start_codon:yes stop_codon:yes gene_type:complete
MYYIKLSDEENANKLIHYCRNCGDENYDLVNDNLSISKIQIKKEDQGYHNYINEYTKLDPTIPRIENMNCPNVECVTNIKQAIEQDDQQNKTKVNVENDILYVRVNDEKLAYIYMCCHCDTTWKSNN